MNLTNAIAINAYSIMLQVTILMLVVDVLSRFDGNPGSIYPDGIFMYGR